MARLVVRTIVAVAMPLFCLAPAAQGAAVSKCVIAEAADFDAWRAKCDAAIVGESDPVERAELLFRRAYVSVEKFRYDDALKDLNEAIAADPDNPLYLHERAYVNGELSEFAAALVDLDRQIALQPEEPSAYRERAHARHFSGDLEGAFEDRDKEVKLRPGAGEALLSRADQALWLGRFDSALADATSAEKLAKGARNKELLDDVAKRMTRIGQWRKTTPVRKGSKGCALDEDVDEKAPATLIGDCTQTFLAATNGFARAEALSTRSVAWRVLANDEASAIEDLRIAVALDPANIERNINLGFAYLATRHSWAARREFDRALAIERNPFALAGRAAARKNLGEADGAREDALASHEEFPNVVAASVLADFEYEKGDKKAARERYLEVYKLGSRDDELIERLKELGVSDPDKATAKP